MFLFLVFYCQDSIKSSLKSSTILHLRNSKLKKFLYKASPCIARLGLPNFNFSPPPTKKSFLRPCRLIKTSSFLIPAQRFCKKFIPQSETKAFIDSVLKNFDEMKPGENIPLKDYGVRLYHTLRGSKELVSGFLSSSCVICPHSMTVERCVLIYNMLYSNLRTSSSEDSLVNRLLLY